MRRQKIKQDKYLMNWYHEYLTNRIIHVELQGIKRTRSLGRGTPQGGVLSPIVWNLVFDKLLEIGNCGAGKMVGFANDASFVVSGIDPFALYDTAQEVVNQAVAWGNLWD